MNKNSNDKESNLDRRNLLIKALNAFDEGDVDLARRILIASYHHHTRKALTVNERLNLWWCLAWFAFYEGCSEKGELIVRQIVKLEESFVEPRKSKIIYAKYVLSILCSKSGKESESMKHAQEVARLLKDSDMQPLLKQIVTAQLNAKTPSDMPTRRSTDQFKSALGATGTSHEIFF
ncbi:MAG TPA: hypothetical protein V6C89_00165 [Drouetiella sp.]|jgi:hypothetical protein